MPPVQDVVAVEVLMREQGSWHKHLVVAELAAAELAAAELVVAEVAVAELAVAELEQKVGAIVLSEVVYYNNTPFHPKSSSPPSVGAAAELPLGLAVASANLLELPRFV